MQEVDLPSDAEKKRYVFRDAPDVTLSHEQVQAAVEVLNEWEYKAVDEWDQHKLVKRIYEAILGKS